MIQQSELRNPWPALLLVKLPGILLLAALPAAVGSLLELAQAIRENGWRDFDQED